MPMPIKVNASVVSIHAPREGCDLDQVIKFKEAEVFQFTHPGRGATTGLCTYG